MGILEYTISLCGGLDVALRGVNRAHSKRDLKDTLPPAGPAQEAGFSNGLLKHMHTDIDTHTHTHTTWTSYDTHAHTQ